MMPTNIRWNCRVCGAQPLHAGRYQHCPNCGHRRDYDTQRLPTWEEFLDPSSDPYLGMAARCCDQYYSERACCCGVCGRRLSPHAASEVSPCDPSAVVLPSPPRGWSLWIDERLPEEALLGLEPEPSPLSDEVAVEPLDEP